MGRFPIRSCKVGTARDAAKVVNSHAFVSLVKGSEVLEGRHVSVRGGSAMVRRVGGEGVGGRFGGQSPPYKMRRAVGLLCAVRGARVVRRGAPDAIRGHRESKKMAAAAGARWYD